MTWINKLRGELRFLSFYFLKTMWYPIISIILLFVSIPVILLLLKRVEKWNYLYPTEIEDYFILTLIALFVSCLWPLTIAVAIFVGYFYLCVKIIDK